MTFVILIYHKHCMKLSNIKNKRLTSVFLSKAQCLSGKVFDLSFWEVAGLSLTKGTTLCT